MTVQAIHHINLRVSAQQMRMLRDFYCEVIGLTEGFRPPFNSSGFWLYAGDVPIVHLAQLPQGLSAALPDGLEQKSAFDHIAFKCSGLEQTLDLLRRRGIAFAVNEIMLTRQIQVVLRDPVGTKIELNFDAGAE